MLCVADLASCWAHGRGLVAALAHGQGSYRRGLVATLAHSQGSYRRGLVVALAYRTLCSACCW